MISISKITAALGIIGYLSLLGSCFLADIQIDQLKAKIKEDGELIQHMKSQLKKLEPITKENE